MQQQSTDSTTTTTTDGIASGGNGNTADARKISQNASGIEQKIRELELNLSEEKCSKDVEVATPFQQDLKTIQNKFKFVLTITTGGISLLRHQNQKNISLENAIQRICSDLHYFFHFQCKMYYKGKSDARLKNSKTLCGFDFHEL